ncbi:hypothetical protein KUV50_07610 [Membranicola marinus]|uniref:Uncharacterized protein n=1 Tax=Membranihabitans marinus TaxID=1227546 RepID=A0A953L8R2_9BACT|nr:hypothetical protein [Membranihabitans marinus]MBY5957990.1 hypothetical protein [Membranihabitans marinus]
MDAPLKYDEKLVRKPAFLMLFLGAIPVYLVVSYANYSHENLTIVQMAFGYMWLWCAGVVMYWHYKKVVTRPVFYIFTLTFGALFIVFLPYFFSDAFTDLFWK